MSLSDWEIEICHMDWPRGCEKGHVDVKNALSPFTDSDWAR